MTCSTPHRRRPSRRSRASRAPVTVAKARGQLHPQAQQVGPERFGILCVDCAKARSTWMLADFYGRILFPPTDVCHTRGEMEATISQLQQTLARDGIADAIAVVERTGSYHLLPKQALARAGWQVRIVHPLATRQFRQSADAGNKTDQTDLMAIHRAAVTGLGLTEQTLEEPYQKLRLLVRHRRALVSMTTQLRCQIHHHLHAAMPGFGALFRDLWSSPMPMTIVREVGSAAAVAQMGQAELARLLHQRRITHQQRSLDKVVAWAHAAPPPDDNAATHHQFCIQLDEGLANLHHLIQDTERQIAQLLVLTPYILLLSIPGINVVSAGELAGEMGPITHYASATCITGRAGLYPSRYQSDRTDHPDGPLVRRGNRRLRRALMTIAENLLTCNGHFRGKAQYWELQGKNKAKARVKVANNFARIAFQMVAGRMVFAHRCCRERDYVLHKLVEFACVHQMPGEQLLHALQAATGQLPAAEHKAEGEKLQPWLRRPHRSRNQEPQSLGEILPQVLAELGLTAVLESAPLRSQGSS